jgi:nodulation protein F
VWDDRFERLLRKRLPFLRADEPLNGDANLREWGLDSMSLVELLASLEKEYGVRFVDDALDFDNRVTPAALWATVSQLIEPVG